VLINALIRQLYYYFTLSLREMVNLTYQQRLTANSIDNGSSRHTLHSSRCRWVWAPIVGLHLPFMRTTHSTSKAPTRWRQWLR